MSDSNEIGLTGFLGLSKPLIKFFETLWIGIGKMYEPIHIKRMAKAKAKEINIISEALANNAVLPISYQDGAITISTEETNDLISRAQNRILFQELRKQQNIDAVVSEAYNQLENTDSVSDTPVDIDWVNEFFDTIANISSEKMQQLWGKLLAGEIMQPGSFSLRTIETLKKLSQKEARIFEEISPYILSCKGDKEGSYYDYFLLRDGDGSLLNKYGIPFYKILMLSEAGLLSQNGLITVGFNIEANDSATITGLSKTLTIKNIGKTPLEVSHSVYILTESGKELLPIVLTKTQEKELKANEYLRDCVNVLKNDGLTMINKSFMQNTNNLLWEIID